MTGKLVASGHTHILPFFASPTTDYYRSMHLAPEQSRALELDPALLFDTLSLAPDPWQTEVLRSNRPRTLLNCRRQAGKSTTVVAPALQTALFHPGSLVLILSRAQRQSGEMFRKVLDFYNALNWPMKPEAKLSLRQRTPRKASVFC